MVIGRKVRSKVLVSPALACLQRRFRSRAASCPGRERTDNRWPGRPGTARRPSCRGKSITTRSSFGGSAVGILVGKHAACAGCRGLVDFGGADFEVGRSISAADRSPGVNSDKPRKWRRTRGEWRFRWSSARCADNRQRAFLFGHGFAEDAIQFGSDSTSWRAWSPYCCLTMLNGTLPGRKPGIFMFCPCASGAVPFLFDVSDGDGRGRRGVRVR